MKYTPAIDGLRAVAISMVIFSHLWLDGPIPGGFGVTLFFFISGYLITRLLLTEHEETGQVDIRRFFVRRLMRLAPAVLVMIVGVSSTYLLVLNRTSGTEISAAMFYLMNYYQILGGNMALPFGPLWSLAIEEHFYLVFPFALVLSRLRAERFFLGLVVVTVGVLVWRYILVLNDASVARTYMATDTRIDSILYGALLAIATMSGFRINWMLRWPVVVGALGLLMMTFVVRDHLFRETIRYSIQGGALIPLFHFALSGRSPLTALLETPPAVWLGKLSYSLYLWHFPVIMFIDKVLGPHSIATLALKLCVSAALTCVSFFFVERPMRELGRSFSNSSCRT